MLAWTAFVLGASPLFAFAAIKIGSFGLLLPVYVTVAHRMFPFFAGNAVPGYKPWRPMWVLGVGFALLMLHLAFELTHAYAWSWIADLPLSRPEKIHRPCPRRPGPRRIRGRTHSRTARAGRASRRRGPRARGAASRG